MKTQEKEAEAFAFEFVDMLQAPIMTFDAGWANCIPERLIKIITVQRLISGLKRESMATLAEVSAYMITRTFLAPLDSDWTEIYTFVSCTVCEESFGEDHWKEVCPDKRLNDYQQGLLLRLRRWIYEKRRQAVQKRMKLEKQKGISTSKYISELYNFDQ